MGGLDITDRATEYYFTQGVLGVTCLVLIVLCIYLERRRIQSEAACKAEVEALEEKHALELASAWKYSRELQEKRIIELQAGVESQKKAIDLAGLLLNHRTGDTQ